MSLTEYNANRIATALERIADLLEQAAKVPKMLGPTEWHEPAYPVGDPAPFLVAGIGETLKAMQPTTLRVRLPESFSVTDRPIPGGINPSAGANGPAGPAT